MNEARHERYLRFRAHLFEKHALTENDGIYLGVGDDMCSATEKQHAFLHCKTPDVRYGHVTELEAE